MSVEWREKMTRMAFKKIDGQMAEKLNMTGFQT